MGVAPLIGMIERDAEPRVARGGSRAEAAPHRLTQPETHMLKGIAKAVAYYKAPAKTFALLHPFKAAKWGGIFLLVGMAIKRTARRGEATRTG